MTPSHASARLTRFKQAARLLVRKRGYVAEHPGASEVQLRAMITTVSDTKIF
jgi:hypothetical protein